MTIEELNHEVNKMHNTISSNVIHFRKQKEYSQLQLALDIGLTGNAFIARAERRVNNAHFNIEHLIKISLILDVKLYDFFHYQSKMGNTDSPKT